MAACALGASEVLADEKPVSIGSGALLNLAGNTETISPHTITGASVATGAGALILGGDVTVGLSAAAIPTVFDSTVSTAGVARTIDVANGAAGEDLVVNATVAGATGIIFAGANTVRLNADNTGFAGGFRFNSSPWQVILLASPNALGISMAELSGTILSAVVSLTGANKLTTPIRIGVNAVTIDMGNIELGGVITFVPFGLLKLTVNGPAVLSGFLDTTLPNATVQKTGLGALMLNGSGTGSGKLQIDSGRWGWRVDPLWETPSSRFDLPLA